MDYASSCLELYLFQHIFVENKRVLVGGACLYEKEGFGMPREEIKNGDYY